MGRRRKRRQSGPEELIVGLVFIFGGWALLSGGGPAGFLRNMFAVILLMGVVGVTVVSYRAWSSRRSDRTVLSAAPTYSRGVRRLEPQGPDLLDQVRSGRDPLPGNASLTERPTDWTMDVISALEWKRFEELCQGFWKAKGYPADLSGPGADGGVDVFIRDRRDASKNFAVIQCKARSSRVGVEQVRALWGAREHFGATLAIFYGRSGFTQDAERFAAEKHLRLVPGVKLLEQLKSLTTEQQQELLSYVTRGDYTTPTCPSCDIKMVRRSGPDFADFWGCDNFPRCRQKMPMSASSRRS